MIVKAVAVHADSTDKQKLTSLLAGCFILINAAYNGTVLPAIQAAIRTGTYYCDVNVVIEQALQLAPEAEAVAITSIVVSGVTPIRNNSTT